jgi:galactokinase
MVVTLLQQDFEKYLKLVFQSGSSSFKYLQNCYSTKDVKNQGIPVAMALSEGFLDGKGVCRVHGGGFAGTIQAYVPVDKADDYKNFMESLLGKNTVKRLKIREASAGPVLLT